MSDSSQSQETSTGPGSKAGSTNGSDRLSTSSGPPSWLVNLIKNWGLTRLGHEAFMLDKIQRQQKIVEATAKNAWLGEGEAPDLRGWPEEDMGVSIGNEVHYHVQQRDASAGKSPASAWKKILLGAVGAALLGGGGTGLGMWLESLREKGPEAPVITPSDTDTFWVHEFE